MKRQQNITFGQRIHAAQSATLEANEELVHWVVKRQCLGRLSYDDAVQEGRIGLWHAIERYDPSKGRLAGYAVPAIQRRVWRAAGIASREAHAALSDEPSSPDSALCTALDWADKRILLEQLVTRLPRRLQFVIVLRYGLDGAAETSFVQIGWMLGVTKQRAHQLHTEALLFLADPATSTALRRHAGRNRRRDIHAYLARRRAWQRQGRAR